MTSDRLLRLAWTAAVDALAPLAHVAWFLWLSAGLGMVGVALEVASRVHRRRPS